MNRILLAVMSILSTVVMVPSLYCQLHLIAATPTPKSIGTYAASLFRVQRDGALQLVQDIIPSDLGVDWLSLSYDLRKAVVVSRGSYRPGGVVAIIDFDAAKVVKECRSEPPVDMSLIEQWLADGPELGGFYLQEFSRGSTNLFRGLALDPARGCEDSLAPRPLEDARFVMVNGNAGVGVAFFGAFDATEIRILPDGTLAKWLLGKEIMLGTAIPREMVAGMNRPYTYLAVRNRQVVAVGLSEIDSKRNSGRPVVTHRTLIACLTGNNKCHEAPLGSAGFSVRGFGPNLAITEMADRRGTPDEQSAGQEEWRKEGSRWGGSVKYAMETADSVYPGRLHVYNVATRRDHVIVTKQADSEVLLVEGDTVYYRVSNRLYQATLADGGVTNRVLVATSDVLRDVHWAFRSIADAN